MTIHDYPLIGVYRCLDPSDAADNATRHGTPMDFHRKANSISLPRGAEPGTAWLLMRKTDLAKLDRTALHDIKWTASNGTFTFKHWIIVDAAAMDFHYENATGTTYFVVLQDIRRLYKRSCLAAQYNVRIPAPPTDATTADLYYTDTLKSGAVWTWDEILSDIWDAIYEKVPTGISKPTAPTLPYTPATTAENLRFIGVSAWDAFNAILDMVHCAFVLDPIADTFTIIQLGVEQTTFTTVKNDAAKKERLLYDAGGDTYNQLAAMPDTIRVFFRKRVRFAGTERDTPDDKNWEIGQWYSIDKSTAATNGFGVLPVWGDLDALYDDQTLANSSDLDDRAAEIATSITNRVIYGHTGMLRIYSGLLTDVMPGSEVECVVWRNYGDEYGTVTELQETREKELASDLAAQFLKPCDMPHATRPNYPQVAQFVTITGDWQDTDDSPAGANCWPGRVAINIEGVWHDLDDCFIKTTSGTDIGLYDADLLNQYHGPARLCGMIESNEETRPLYIMEDTFPRKPYIRFELTEALTTSDASATATMITEWGPGYSAGTVSVLEVTVLNHETHTPGTYELYADSGDTGIAIHKVGDQYQIVFMECP